MKDPIEVLKNEHRVIESALEAIEATVSRRQADPFPRDFFAQATEFITGYADQWHHGKEEDRLFPMLQQCGIPRDAGPIGCMLDDHEARRAHVRAICESLDAAERGDPKAVSAVYDEAVAYCRLLRDHIYKEDNVLFEMGRQVLCGADVDALRREFDEAERTRGGEASAERYLALAAQLRAEAGLVPEESN
jgi:hemerythrin-like domain-containing protein